jgi:hypothetical protein
MQSETTQPPPATDQNQTALVQAFIKTDIKRIELEASLEETKGTLASLSEQIRESVLDTGVNPSGATYMGRVFRIVTRRWPKVLDQKALVQIMQSDPATAGLVQTTVNYQSLRGYIGELIHDATDHLSTSDKADFEVKEAVPEKLKGVLEITEKQDLATYAK